MPRETLPSSYFEAKYQVSIDPWEFRTSDYERKKYAATIAALTKPRYEYGLEVGCSIGVLTALLSHRCDQLLAIDGSKTAIDEARRLKLSGVQFEITSLPNGFPDNSFDLVMLSEVLYYFSHADLMRVAELTVKSLRPDGDVVLCHWLGATDYPMTGIQASDRFAAAVRSSLKVRTILHDEVYRLERFSA